MKRLWKRLFRRAPKPLVTAIAADHIRAGELIIIMGGRAFVVPADRLTQPPTRK